MPVAGLLYLIWRWVVRAPGLPVPPFWSRSKLVACAIFAVVFLIYAAVLPAKEFDYWGGRIAAYGHWSLLVILFPEINRVFVSRMTLDDLTTIEVTRGFGWALFSIWLVVTLAISIGFLL